MVIARKIKKIITQEDGMAFITTIAFVFFSLAMLICLTKRIDTVLIVSEHETFFEQGQDGKYVALGRALNLLQTGKPPANTSAYSISLTERTGKPEYAVTYKYKGKDSWSVKAEPLTETLPPLPDTFG